MKRRMDWKQLFNPCCAAPPTNSKLVRAGPRYHYLSAKLCSCFWSCLWWGGSCILHGWQKILLLQASIQLHRCCVTNIVLPCLTVCVCRMLISSCRDAVSRTLLTSFKNGYYSPMHMSFPCDVLMKRNSPCDLRALVFGFFQLAKCGWRHVHPAWWQAQTSLDLRAKCTQ